MRSALLQEPKTIVMRGPSGFGDAIYTRPIAEHIARRGNPVQVLSDYPEVFRGANVEVRPFNRLPRLNVVAHYATGKSNPGTNQWEDMCRSAGISAPLALRFDWTVTNRDLVSELFRLAAGRPIVLVHGGHAPMDRADGFGVELRPDKRAFDAALAGLADCFLVRVGKACRTGPGYELRTELDLRDRTSVSDLIDIGVICSGWLAQCSLAVPLAEAFDKPLLAVWSSNGLRARSSFVRQVTPQKVLSGPRSRFIFDSETKGAVQDAARALKEAMA